MTNSFDKIIESLKEKIIDMPDHWIFQPSTTQQRIWEVESELGITLPKSYKQFLQNFNGGFACNDYCAKIIKERNAIEDAEWNSISIFSLEKLKTMYENKRAMGWKFHDNSSSPKVYPFIPFCQTTNGELLIFVNYLDENDECPVFDAFHEEFASSWGMLYENFGEFLLDYIESDGTISMISYDSPTVSEYIESKQIIKGT